MAVISIMTAGPTRRTEVLVKDIQYSGSQHFLSVKMIGDGGLSYKLDTKVAMRDLMWIAM